MTSHRYEVIQAMTIRNVGSIHHRAGYDDCANCAVLRLGDACRQGDQTSDTSDYSSILVICTVHDAWMAFVDTAHV